MTDTELQGIGAQASNMAKRDMARGEFNFLFASYHKCDVPPLHRMTKIEATIIERLGRDWLNSGRTKDAGFRVLRMMVDLLPPDAVAIVTIVNRFNPTARFHKLPEAEQEAIMNASHDQHHEAVADGLLILVDALFAIVQTPERVCQYIQDYDRRGQPEGKPQTLYFRQAELSGRLKMFGDPVEWAHQA